MTIFNYLLNILSFNRRFDSEQKYLKDIALLH